MMKVLASSKGCLNMGILVNRILELWRLCPLSDITRCAAENTGIWDQRMVTQIIIKIDGLGLEGRPKEVQDLRQVEDDQEATKSEIMTT